MASLLPQPLTGQKLAASEGAMRADLSSGASVHVKSGAALSRAKTPRNISGSSKLAAEDETIEALLLVSEAQPPTTAGSATLAEAEAEAKGTAQALNPPQVSRLVKAEPVATSSVNSITDTEAQSNIESPDGAPTYNSKPTILGSNNKRRTTDRASINNYGGRVWAALAQNKPKADRRGSATVNFAIKASGQLGHVRVSESSGSDRLDQLALSAVRNSAPFPAPPNGRASYTIRIDFQ
jgi:protein TonB